MSDENEVPFWDLPLTQFITKRIFATYPKHTIEKFNKALQNENNSEILECFISEKEKRYLFVPESLKTSLTMPPKLPKVKCLAFMKLVDVLTDENVTSSTITVELGGQSSFEQFELVSNNVLLPVLLNGPNQNEWGEVATKEITDTFHTFLSSTTILCGQINGETRLPMPLLAADGVNVTSQNRISILEGAIIMWTKQIKNVLKQDPESLLKQGYHPTPDVEIEFWKSKAMNLNSIFKQLQSRLIRRVLKALDQAKSTYCTTFARLCKEVFNARLEANDNVKHLLFLEEWFSKLNNEVDFSRLQLLFKPMMHSLYLIWKNSKYYCIPARLVVIMREICNSLIEQARKYISGETIFNLIENDEAGVAVEQLRNAIIVCGTFKKTYVEYKTIVVSECLKNPWHIQNNAIFMRLDSFLERCYDILDLTQTIIQFTKLSKVEIGGTKGKTLSASVQQIYLEFNDSVDVFKKLNYEVMDISAIQFDQDYQNFRSSLKEFERRIGSLICLALDDCNTVYSRFQVLDSFDSGLLGRSIIQDELEMKYLGIVERYGKDLKNVRSIFIAHCDSHPCEASRNLPPISGSLTWCRGLKSRVQNSMVKLLEFDRNILDREEAKEVAKIQVAFMSSLNEFETQKIEEWGRDVEVSSEAKLKLPLVRRTKTGELVSNFDPSLVRLLREVKYFLLLGLTVPDSALQVYQSAEIYRSWTGNLDIIVNIYNSILNQLLPVEKPLVAPYLAKFDEVIEKGISFFNWRSDGVEEFINLSMQQVILVNGLVKTIKDNFAAIEETVRQWREPLIKRKLKPERKDEFERAANASILTRSNEIAESGKNIHSLLEETNNVLKVPITSLVWRSYIEFVSNVVMDGLSTAVTKSLEYLLDQVDSSTIRKEGKFPLLELKMELVENHNLQYTPPGLAEVMHRMIGSFLQISTLFKRIDSDGNYMKEMHMNIEIKNCMSLLSEALTENEMKCLELKQQFDSYSYLWTTDLKKYFHEFCLESTITTENGLKLLDTEKFDVAINKCTEVQVAVAKFKSSYDIGWLRIITTPAKQQISLHATKWIDMFITHILNTATNSMKGIHEFIGNVSESLDCEINDKLENKEMLMSVMSTVRDVRKKMDSVDLLFDHQRQCTQRLRQHGIDILREHVFGKNLQDFVEEIPMAWEAIVKKTLKKKEDILPIQMASANALKLDLEEFYLSIRQFREDFRLNAPFKFGGICLEAYSIIDIYARKLDELELKTNKFHELEDLFELQQTNYPEIGETRDEIKYLKILWDLKSMICSTFAQWKTSLWSEVDTESLDDRNKKLRKQIKEKSNSYPAIKAWQVYRDIESSLGDMNIVLPLINDLHSDAMRTRHWAALARVCNVKVVDPSDDNFTLNDMMVLNLHKHKEEIEEIVETATKEMKIEKKLKEIEDVWSSMTLDYAQYKDTDIFVPHPAEEVVEGMEAHQMELQGIYGMGKFMEYFKDRVINWQSTLRTVDDTLRIWTAVAKAWASLESIFLSSVDIRKQLPDDTKRFEGIDSEFRELMKFSIAESNCLKVCSVEGRYDALMGMRQRLEMCQKSLNEYLDIKKKVFPRFYFVSSVALLDILANGTNPPKIMPYLGDCYDALANLKFIKQKNGEVSNKTTDTMIAKDGETIQFSEVFTMEGEVEAYLNHLTLAMQAALKKILSDAIEKAANWEIDAPRHEWLFDYPAQLCITGTQIYWTDETQIALEEYEGGQEDSVKRYLLLCNTRLTALIQLVLGDLTAYNRTKIISLITMDVHSRDVVQRLVDQKIEGPSAFAWQQQLRFEWDQKSLDVNIKICDFSCKYFYEWVGNTGRLVITPLTDRCYITLTMALKLYLGGAPAGPAGTGKTETTKDLARALAIPCYVFNCSDQMNFQSMADIFRGLAQTGAWGWIPIEVLSVVATQVKTIQDAIIKFSKPENRDPEFQSVPSGCPPVKVGVFDFMGDVISLIPTCGFWITMNPGYAGRTELPENLKALFRSCAMIRPDMKLIQENMLMAEGFQTARMLAIKFNTLYDLSAALLSKQPHYDWGLRSVKSVLRVAGSMKRANPTLDESQVLMRALRDFNTPKIPAHDIQIFLRIINDLFMGITVESKVDEGLKTKIVTVAKATGLQYDEVFVNKTCNFQELLDVRHSVMLLGPTGSSKTTIWKTLQATHNLDKTKKVCVSEVVNPKSVTGDELYGYMTLSKEWKDGVLSIIMRGMSKNTADLGFHEYQTYKWVVLDGDIDAVWIESMNTVMDDNKVLTLVSNERVPLSPAMRMVFEINSLKNATPATVSRAGILYINETDIGWRPFMESWVQRRIHATEKNILPSLFDRYIDALAEMTRRGYKEVTSIRLINKVSTIIFLLEGLLSNVPEDKLTSDTVEMIFAFSAMWAFGGPMMIDKSGDYRKKFSEDFLSTFGSIFPQEGQCFDYFYNPALGEFVHWQSSVPKYVPIPIGKDSNETPFNALFVETVETVRMKFLLNTLTKNGKYTMLVGNVGTGKTETIKNYLGSLDKDTDGVISRNIVMSYYTSSYTLQQEMESYIDKRSGTYFGPPMGKKMVFFVDDINLPYIETYGTQNPIALLTQHMQHGSIFDRSDLGMRKSLVDIQYIAAMNPTVGSFEICERCQRHFATFAVSMPSKSDLVTIFSSLFGGHLESFQPNIQQLCGKIVDTAIQLHETISANFLPSAIRFMYNWNMRDMTNVFQGLCLAKGDYYIKPSMLARLFVHEATRVYSDRLISEGEIKAFDEMLEDIAKKTHLSSAIEDMFSPPIVYTNFVTTTDGSYLPIPSMEKLKSIVDSKLFEYNENNPMMDLVLFEQAILHVTRINRIIQNPGGNAMLIGVGGSGKQSLCRLASFINDCEVMQLSVTSNFKIEDLKEELRAMYLSAGVRGIQIVFLMTDSQIVNEEFLVYINGILTSGWISDLFAKEDIDNILGALGNEAKAAGIVDTNEARLNFFVSRVRKNLHLVLAFSPVGEAFRIRARRFPGLVNCTVIDQFHPWPREALVSVAERFIQDVEIPGPENIRSCLANHMAEEHLSVARMSQHYFEVYRRYNYVTPKSFLELIAFFKFLLDNKGGDLQRLIDRLDVGLSTLKKTSKEVAELQKDLEITMVQVEEKKLKTNKLIEEMSVQQQDAKIQQDAAQIEAEKANLESSKALEIETQSEGELKAAKPAMEAAAGAVDCLSKPMLTELKNLGKPPAGVDNVTNTCLILLEKEYNPKKLTWDRAKKMMASVDAFKTKLAEFKGENITEKEIQLLEKYVKDEGFTPEKMLAKSAAASNLCTWVVSIYAYNRIYVKVKPLMDSLEAARASKAAAMGNLEVAEAKVAEVQKQLKALEEKYQEALREKEEVESQADALTSKADLAQRLLGGLASENVRWGQEIDKLRQSSLTITGDCMLAAGFVSYIGSFTQELREDLWKNQWTTDLKTRNIPMSEGSDPLTILTNDSNNAKMISEGLPSDRISLENGAIVTNCKRWPLIIDPQTQGIKWLRRKEENVDIVQLSQSHWLKTVQSAVTNGSCVIIENIGSEIDATLDPVLSRAIYKKGRNLYIKLAGEEVEYDAAFQLYLQTKLNNPHYKPEIAAQCTIINFIATEKGLEDQLLAKVVEMEREDLEDKARELTSAARSYQVQLVALEDELLERLANAPDDILSDVPLIEGLEATKKTAKEINEAVARGKITQQEVEQAREAYRAQAAEGAMLYFLLTKLSAIDHMYQYSLDSFMYFFEKSVKKAEPKENLNDRVESLRDSLRMTIFTWVARGLFERHKIIFLAQLTFNLMKRGIIGDNDWKESHFQFLLRAPTKTGDNNAVPWLSKSAWMTVSALGDIEEFAKFPSDLVEAAPRFREWFNAVSPENEKLPLDWAGLDRTPFQKMLVVRCMRPDRMATALRNFVRKVLPNGSSYADCDSTFNSLEILDQSLKDSTSRTPIFFILSPGANVVADLDVLATKYDFQKGKSYHNVSMGQGQDIIAMSYLETANQNGHWVILNNVHLMPKWLTELEKKLDKYAAEDSHEKFRLFLTSDPSTSIPIGILNRCIKLTNEPPSGLKANLKRAWCFFPKEYIEDADSKTKSILFGLCHFHSIIMERKLFGPMGFNMKYPFSIGDLRDSATCLQNYMENSGGGKIPWQDLKYIFGEIMYGGHVVNDFDRLLVNEYLNFYMKDELLDEMQMYPFLDDEKGASFITPVPTTFEKYIEHIDNTMGEDTPVAFGLHPNAEIDFRTQQSTMIFKTLMELQPREASSADGAITPQQAAESLSNEILDKFGEKMFDIEGLVRSLDEQGPYQNVFIQEMDVMNVLLTEIQRSVKELQLGFAGELTMSDAMEGLMNSLYIDKVPDSWSKKSWPSLRSLSSWLNNFLDRLNQLDEWTADPSTIPKVTWLSGLINPTSFLTAICQVTAQKNQLELDKLVTFTDVTKRLSVEEIDGCSRDGAYIIGLSMQGARWDTSNVQIEKSQPKEMFSQMPIINVKAVTKDKANVGGIYHCPVYMTESRGPTWFFNAQLKTKFPPAKWVLAGVALIADKSS